MKNRYAILISDCVLLIFLGLVYAWSIFKKPLAAAYGWNPFSVPDVLVLVNTGTLNYWHKIIVTELDRVEEGTRVRMEKAKKIVGKSILKLKTFLKFMTW